MTKPDDKLIILLHGVGSNGTFMATLSRYWQATLPGATVISPRCSHRLRSGWRLSMVSIPAVSDTNRSGRILVVREDFDYCLADLIECHGFADRLRQVALVGFSQGAIMPLDALAGRYRSGLIGAVVIPRSPESGPDYAAVADPRPG